MENTKKGDFVELLYTGISQGAVFDSNIPEDLKQLNKEANPQQLIVAVGEGMVVSGLDKALEDKEIGKKYTVILQAKEAFGERQKELLKTLPLKIFHEKQIMPKAGMVLAMDNMLVKVVAVSGARVIADFNNPLAGKEVEYSFTILRKVADESEKARAFFAFFWRFVPEFGIGEKIIVKGPAVFEQLVKHSQEKSKALLGKELTFELKEEMKEAEKEEMKN